MIVEFSCIIARNKEGKAIWGEVISGGYSKVCMTLYRDWGLTFDDVFKYGENMYGDRVYSAFGAHLDRFKKEGKLILQQEAKDLCGRYGDILVEIEVFGKEIF